MSSYRVPPFANCVLRIWWKSYITAHGYSGICPVANTATLSTVISIQGFELFLFSFPDPFLFRFPMCPQRYQKLSDRRSSTQNAYQTRYLYLGRLCSFQGTMKEVLRLLSPTTHLHCSLVSTLFKKFYIWSIFLFVHFFFSFSSICRFRNKMILLLFPSSCAVSTVFRFR